MGFVGRLSLPGDRYSAISAFASADKRPKSRGIALLYSAFRLGCSIAGTGISANRSGRDRRSLQKIEWGRKKQLIGLLIGYNLPSISNCQEITHVAKLALDRNQPWRAASLPDLRTRRSVRRFPEGARNLRSLRGQ